MGRSALSGNLYSVLSTRLFCTGVVERFCSLRTPVLIALHRRKPWLNISLGALIAVVVGMIGMHPLAQRLVMGVGAKDIISATCDALCVNPRE